jgi:hypothetical protein
LETAALIRIALLVLVACRGSNSAPPAPGSASGVAPPADAAPIVGIDAGIRTDCIAENSVVKLALHGDTPVACVGDFCIRPAAKEPAARVDATRPPPWIDTPEVRMDKGVLSACSNGCRPLGNRLATLLAGTDPSKVSVSTDTELILVGKQIWRVRFDRETELVVGEQKRTPTRIVFAGPFLLATFEKSGQLYDASLLELGLALRTYDPGDPFQLDKELFVVTNRAEPQVGIFDMATGALVHELSQFTGFSIIDAIRIKPNVAAFVMTDATGFWIVTFTADRKTPTTITAMRAVPYC